MIMSVFEIMILVLILQESHQLVPRICQTEVKGTIYHLNDLSTCNNLQIEEVEIELETANVKPYETKGKSLVVFDKYCRATEDFFGAKSNSKSTIRRTIPQHEAENMIKNGVCIDFHGKKRITNFQSTHECRYKWMETTTTVTTTCILKEGKVSATHSRTMKTDLGDVSNCRYDAGYCETGKMSLLWTVNSQVVEEYINLRKLECNKIDSHVICEDISESFDLSKFQYDSRTQHYLDGTFRIKILQIKNSTVSRLTSPMKYSLTNGDNFGEQIQALQSEMIAKFQYLLDFMESPQGKLNTICLALLQTNKLMKSSIGKIATEFAQMSFHNNNLVAKATQNFLVTFPCIKYDFEEVTFRKSSMCYDKIPVAINGQEYFMNENLIVTKHAATVNCSLVPSKVFEFNGKLYIQRKNDLPVSQQTDGSRSLSFLTKFNLTGLNDLSNNFSFVPELTDYSAGLVNNMDERLRAMSDFENDFRVHRHISEKISVFGLLNLSIFGCIDAALTWITRIGSILAIYMFFKLKFRNSSGFALVTRSNEESNL